jgi:hypothetical protein
VHSPVGRDVLGNDRDDDGDLVSLLLVSSPSHGTLETLADGTFRYEPAADYTGTDRFTYKLDDGKAESGTATVTLVVNGPPATAGDPFSMDEGDVLSVASSGVLANDSDGEQDRMTIHVVTEPAHGIFAASPDGSFTYTPQGDFNGLDTWSYRARRWCGSRSARSTTRRRPRRAVSSSIRASLPRSVWRSTTAIRRSRKPSLSRSSPRPSTAI